MSIFGGGLSSPPLPPSHQPDPTPFSSAPSSPTSTNYHTPHSHLSRSSSSPHPAPFSSDPAPPPSDIYHYSDSDDDLLPQRTPSPVFFGDKPTHYGEAEQYIGIMEAVTWEQELDAARTAKIVWDLRQAVKRGDLRAMGDAEWRREVEGVEGVEVEVEKEGEKEDEDVVKGKSEGFADLVGGRFAAWPLKRTRVPREWDDPVPLEPPRKKKKRGLDLQHTITPMFRDIDSDTVVEKWWKPKKREYYNPVPPTEKHNHQYDSDFIDDSDIEDNNGEEEFTTPDDLCFPSHLADPNLPQPKHTILQPLKNALVAHHLRAAKPYLKKQPIDDDASAEALAGVIGTQTACAIAVLDDLYRTRKRQMLSDIYKSQVRKRFMGGGKVRKAAKKSSSKPTDVDADEENNADDDSNNSNNEDDEDGDIPMPNTPQTTTATNPPQKRSWTIQDVTYNQFVDYRRRILTPLTWTSILSSASALSSTTRLTSGLPRFSLAAIERAEQRCELLFGRNSAQKKRDDVLKELRDALREPVVWGDEKRWKYHEVKTGHKRLKRYGRSMEKKRRKAEEEAKHTGENEQDENGEEEERLDEIALPGYESWYGFSSDDDCAGAEKEELDIPADLPPFVRDDAEEGSSVEDLEGELHEYDSAIDDDDGGGEGMSEDESRAMSPSSSSSSSSSE
ncbi:hypothetical protein EX30DRAFT_369524 [Ascodesmis nigricans]|uniref:Uncharacterized protein n=1 Tax=Ascodesmis nigricans TaxID=341454 RepID=A0A4S2N4V6_9PEZI|nr:hypothetical protein EX30DRAFT_369524 [Ascodesmis nigricans]